MAQPQRQADVHQDELCPPNKRYALMDANKKIDLEHSLCLNESKILENILQNHLLRFSIVASSSVPWIYLGQTIFRLPQATDNNHDHFVPAPKFSEMVPFYINDLGFTLEFRSPSNFKTTDHADDCSALFTKLIVSHYMTAFPKTSRRARDKYHNLDDDEMVKRIFNSRKHKDRVGMKIPMFRVDVPMTQSQPIESIQGMHRITSAPRTPNPDQKSRKELEAKQNEEIVKEHLMAEEIEKLVEGTENVEENVKVDSSTLRKNEIKMILTLEEEESAEDDHELKRKEKRKHVEESRHTPSPTTNRSYRIHYTLISLDTEKLQELTVNDPPPSSSTPSSSSPRSKLSATNRLLSLFKPKTGIFKQYKSFFGELQGCYSYLFEHLKIRFMPRTKFNALAQHLQELMEDSLPKMVDDRVKELTKIQVPIYVA
ncbi:hypothetical protein Tco_1228655 [Tanacetum coccineum]